MLEDLHTLAGMRVVPHPLAREVRDEWKVERHPTPKKRRQWRVVKHHIDRPGCYQVGNTLYMHPELMERLRRATLTSNAKGQRGAEGASAAPTGCASNDGSENNLQNSEGNAAGGRSE